MTTLDTTPTRRALVPPYSSRIRAGLGLCLVLGGVLNGGSQYLVELLSPDHEQLQRPVPLGHGTPDPPPGRAVRAGAEHALPAARTGILLLSIACWRSGVFPKVPLTLLVVFLAWDFTLPSVGPFEPHLLLMVALVWLGVHLARMPQRIWLGGSATGQPPGSAY